MTYTVLFGRKSIQLSSNNLVVPADHVKAFQSTLVCAQELTQTLESEAARIEAAVQQGQRDGFEQGQREGRQAVDAAFAEAVEQMVRDRHAQQEEARNAVCTLALAVVRKISASLGAQEIVPQLLEQALSTLMPERFNVVRVHPDLVELVRARLPDVGYLIEVRGDEALEPFGCVLDHPQGQQVVGLETQLSMITKALNAEPAPQDFEAA